MDGESKIEPIGYIIGLLDEVEFMGQMPAQHGIVVYGLFSDLHKARNYARTLSTDPDEGVVIPVYKP